MKITLPKIGIAVMLVVSLAACLLLVLYGTGLSYIYCSFRESSWLKAGDEAELEGKLFSFYEKTTITPEMSSWGRDHVLEKDQRMTRYLIFGKEPLDVVYNSDNSIVTIYTTYE